jgi:hypothetical protein
MDQKDIVFYSNLCSYSNEIINLIKENNIDKQLMLINIDDDKISLPNFIKVVPTIYLIKEKMLIIDESILSWIENKKKIFSSDINGYNNNVFSENFSDLQDSELQHNGDFFSSINEDFHINFSSESETKKKLDFNDIQRERSNDLKQLYN